MAFSGAAACRMFSRVLVDRRAGDGNGGQAKPDARHPNEPMNVETRSPCIAVCRLDPQTRVCEGCGRSAREIARWPFAEEAEKRAIVAAAERRRRSPTEPQLDVDGPQPVGTAAGG